MTALHCVICGHDTPEDKAEVAMVHSNVRAFKDESFAYYRCEQCHSVHARDEVDLAHYYAQYPFHNLPVDFRLHQMYANYLKRLRGAGLSQEHTILDFGCGGGHFVDFLKSRGYNAVGFDEYSDKFGDKRLLEQQYDCIVSQDLLEHVPVPAELLTTFESVTKPGSLIAMGTPNATGIDLRQPERYVHTVHAPYHRHIYSEDALKRIGEREGWSLERFFPTMYTNTAMPFLNERFYLYYVGLTQDGTLDAMMEPPRLGPLMLRGPETLFWGLFGGLMSRHTDVMALFRRG